MLSKFGFCEGLPDESVTATLTKAIDADPFAAEDNLKQSYEIWKGVSGSEADPTLDTLLAHASAQAVKERQNAALGLLENDTVDLGTGATIVELLNEAIRTSSRPDILISGAHIAQVFIAGSAHSQTTMRRFFAKELPKDKLFYGNHITDVLKWLESIKDTMTESDHRSKMGKVRAGWFIKDIEEALNALRV